MTTRELRAHERDPGTRDEQEEAERYRSAMTDYFGAILRELDPRCTITRDLVAHLNHAANGDERADAAAYLPAILTAVVRLEVALLDALDAGLTDRGER